MLTTALAFCLVGSVQVPKEIKEEIAIWWPSSEDLVTPPNDVWVKDADIVGAWTTARGYASVIVSPPAKGGNRFRVEFMTGDCQRMMSFGTTATYWGGTLQLDQPAYEQEPFDRFYPVRIKGKVRLVTPRGWMRVQLELSEFRGAIVGDLSYGKSPR